jgi:hypothetical protein
MIHADPWDEVARLEEMLETDLLVELERSRIRMSVESFCVEDCQIDGRCRLARAIHHREQCPVWRYVELAPVGT